MTFTLTDPDENYSQLKMVSETGRWEVGLHPVMFGVRIRAGRAGRATCAVDYCAGADPVFKMRLLDCIIKILSAFPEEIPQAHINEIMPGFDRKPIDQDPCWTQLQKMAAALDERAPA